MIIWIVNRGFRPLFCFYPKARMFGLLLASLDFYFVWCYFQTFKVVMIKCCRYCVERRLEEDKLTCINIIICAKKAQLSPILCDPTNFPSIKRCRVTKGHSVPNSQLPFQRTPMGSWHFVQGVRKFKNVKSSTCSLVQHSIFLSEPISHSKAKKPST